jgi:CheY-like chemotaxis protein
VKYNRVDGEVVVTTTEIDGHIRVEVSDTGLGIDPESMDRLFEPFQRMGKEATKIEGTGLGLALSKALVEAMHGTMGVNTKLGEGSTFWFEVDRTEEATAAPGEGATVSEMRHPDRRAEYHDILYVEDNLANVELADRVLSQERPNLNLVAVSSGVQALEYLEDHHPGLVILDVHLGDINGDEILRHIRATSRLQDLPVIMLSADASKSQIERLLSMGANEYLTKPFRVKTFLHAVDDGLQGTLHSSRMADASA